MKRFHAFLAALLLGLASLGVQAQASTDDDDLALDTPASAQDRTGRPERGARGGGGGGPMREALQTARKGDLPKARAMIDEVIQRQPNNARAHFVKAQIASRDRDFATARAALQEAERLAPGLPFAREEVVTRLRTRLERMEAREGRGQRPRAGRHNVDPAPTAPADSAPSTSTADAGTAASNATTGSPVETRPAGEETRNMGAPSRKEEAKDDRSLLLGIAIGAVIAAIAAALFFRRRGTPG